MNKSIGKKVLIFVLSVVLVFLYTFFFKGLFTDEIWCYGFGYNISRGLIPYRDFNMIVTPLYAFISSIFIIIFGHHLWSMHIMHAIMITIMFFLMHKNLGKKVMILVPVVLFFQILSYNFFCLFLMIVLFRIIDKKKNEDLFVPLILSLIFLTKQTVGIFLFLPMMYYSKNKLRSFILFCAPIMIFLIYLFVNGALYQFIDYCFLGMFDFTSSNKLFILLPLELLVLFILIFFNVKFKFKDKKLFYILMFQVIAFPIVDLIHFGISIILVLYYLLFNVNIKVMRIKYIFVILLFAVFMWEYYQNAFYLNNNYYFYSDKNSYLYGRHIDKYIEESIAKISKYMENIKGKFDNVYLITANAYEIKMNTSYQINKFDLINNGNMGYNGSKKFMKEIDNSCINGSCMFIIYKYEISDDDKYLQINKDIIYHIYKKYDKKGEFDVFYLYGN